MRPPSLAVVLTLTTACCTCPGTTAVHTTIFTFQNEAPPPALDLGYERVDLEGGLPVLHVPAPEGAPVTLSLWIEAGSDAEREDERGAAHVARLALVGAGSDPGGAGTVETIRKHGGEVEAHTTRSHTIVNVTVPSGMVEEAVRVLDPWIAPPAMDLLDIDGALREAAREADGWRASPGSRSRDAVRTLLVGPRPDAGLYPDPARFEALDADAVQGFVGRCWNAPSMVLGVSGAPEIVEALAKLPPPPAGDRGALSLEPRPGSAMALTLEASAMPDRAHLSFGLVLPAVASGQGGASHALALWLSRRDPGTPLGRIAERGVPVDVAIERHPGWTLVILHAEVPAGDVAATVGIVSAEIARVRHLPPAGPDVERAVRITAASWKKALGDPALAPIHLAGQHMQVGGRIAPEDHLAGLFAVESSDVVDLARDLSSPAVAVVPAATHSDETGLCPDADDLAERARRSREALDDLVGAAASSCSTESDAGARTSEGPSGERIVVTPGPAGPLVGLTAVVRAGSTNDPQGREGTARLLGLLMARSLDEAVEALPGLDPEFVEAQTSWDADELTIGLVVPADRIRAGIVALAWALGEPREDPTGFESARQSCMAMARSPLPGDVGAARRAGAAALGLGDAWVTGGSVGSLGTVSVSSVRQFHAQAVARGVVIGISGAPDPAAACTDSVAALVPAAPPPSELLADPAPPIPLPATGQTRQTGGGPMAWVASAWTTPGAGEPGAVAVQMLAELLGGPDGALERRLVHEKGLATSVRVEHARTRNWGLVTIVVGTPATNVEIVMAEMEEILALLATDPPAEPALEQARARMIGGLREMLAAAGTASLLVARETSLVGSWPGAAGLEEMCSGIDGQDVRAAAATWLVGPAPERAIVLGH